MFMPRLSLGENNRACSHGPRGRSLAGRPRPREDVVASAAASGARAHGEAGLGVCASPTDVSACRSSPGLLNTPRTAGECLNP